MTIRFRSLQARLSTLYAGLFAGMTLAVAVLAHLLIVAHAQDAVRAEMLASSGVYDRLWTLRAQALGESAAVLARDFGFRSAVATGDRPTIASALDSLRDRAGVPFAVVVDESGQVTGNPGPLRDAIVGLPDALAPGQRDAVVPTAQGIYRLVVSPILAPEEIGLVVFAVRLDGAEMHALEQMSAMPITATMVRRQDGRWIAADGGAVASAALDRAAAAGPRRLVQLRVGGRPAYALLKRLSAPGGQAEAAILISYGMDDALQPYRPLELALGGVGAVGLLLVLMGSRRLAIRLVRPLAALGAAARALENGTRTELPETDDDELGQLSAAFNRMSAGIVEREHRISHMAFHDALTGLPNRAFFQQQLAVTLARARRGGEAVAVLTLDVDGFKTVNDTLGHLAGDGLLLAVSKLLVEQARDGMVARTGGDEFAIILSGGDVPHRARALAQGVCDRFASPVAVGEHQVPIGASLGIALDDRQCEADTLLKNADLALQRAKEEGRACFRFFDLSLDLAARRRHQLEIDLHDALKKEQFTLNYQPIVGLKPDRIIGMEALLRWRHPTRGPVSPAEFIPVAEESGLIGAIGEWVLREACQQAARWPEDVRLSVNVSPLQFRNPGFMPGLMQALARSGLPPHRLEVEITESVFLDGEEGVIRLLHSLRALGIRVALDDFGTGYSSLSYLRSFPFDKIKIDRSFVTDVADDEGAAAIVQAIVELATALHMETTAEGVELVSQLDKLRLQGCTSIQGYLFSRPVEAGVADDMLAGDRLAQVA